MPWLQRDDPFKNLVYGREQEDRYSKSLPGQVLTLKQAAATGNRVYTLLIKVKNYSRGKVIRPFTSNSQYSRFCSVQFDGI